MKLRWFISGKVRQATDMCHHVRKLVNSQRDILSAQALGAVTASLNETQAAIDSNADKEALTKQMAKLEESAAKWIKPYPNAEWRENIEVFLVAIVVAMAIRTFFLQPFKIPTGSMEPTLYGIEDKDLRDEPGFKMPGPLERVWDLVYDGTLYHEITAPADGEVIGIGPVEHELGFINKQQIWVQYSGDDRRIPLTVWCGPDGRVDREGRLMGMDRGYIQRVFTKGEPIVL
jgi:signal peptidase I